jgi:arsenite methyltransferase
MNQFGGLETCPTGLLDLTREACSRAGWGPGRRVIDIGCGGGSSVGCLRREFGVSAFGVDLSRPSGDAVFQGRAESLPLASGSVDGILAECSLSAMADCDRVIEECRRVLTPGGCLAITDLYARQVDAVTGGIFLREELVEQLSARGFEVRLWEDRSAVLKQLVFRLIMRQDWEQNCCDRGVGQMREWKRVRAGYFLLIARLRKKEPIWATNRCE